MPESAPKVVGTEPPDEDTFNVKIVEVCQNPDLKLLGENPQMKTHSM